MRVVIFKLHYLSLQRVISTSSVSDAFVQIIHEIVDVPVVMQRHVPRSWTSVVKLTGSCDLGVQTVTASQVQYIDELSVIPARSTKDPICTKDSGVTQFQRLDPVMDVPAAIQRQAPTIKTVHGAVDVCQFQCLDRVANVLIPIRQELSFARMCCSSRVPKEHCGRPCCVATTSACDSEGTENRGCPTGPVHSGARSRRLFPSQRTLKSAVLFSLNQTSLYIH